MVKILRANNRGSILLNTVCEVVADIIILDPRNNQQKTTGAAMTSRTMSPEVI